VLPLDLGALGAIAVVGPNGGGCLPDPTSRCDVRNNMIGGYAPDYVSAPTVEDAVRSAFPSASVTFLAGAAINLDDARLGRAGRRDSRCCSVGCRARRAGDSACEGHPLWRVHRGRGG